MRTIIAKDKTLPPTVDFSVKMNEYIYRKTSLESLKWLFVNASDWKWKVYKRCFLVALYDVTSSSSSQGENIINKKQNMNLLYTVWSHWFVRNVYYRKKVACKSRFSHCLAWSYKSCVCSRVKVTSIHLCLWGTVNTQHLIKCAVRICAIRYEYK